MIINVDGGCGGLLSQVSEGGWRKKDAGPDNLYFELSL